MRQISFGLDQALAQELQKWGQMRVAPEEEHSDAIFVGRCDSRIAEGATPSGHVGKVAEMQVSGEVKLADHRTGKTIWTARKDGASVGDLAKQLVRQLKKDFEKPARKKERS